MVVPPPVESMEHTHQYYCLYSDTDRARIGIYAHQYGVTAAARRFSRVLKCCATETTVCSICNVYREDLKLWRWCGITEAMRSLPGKPRGRPLLLGTDLHKKLQLYVKKLREGSAVVSSKVVMAVARGILKVYDRQRLADRE